MNETEQMLETALRARLSELKLSNADLARKLHVQPPHISRVLGRQTGKVPQSLLDVLEALSLELCVRPKF